MKGKVARRILAQFVLCALLPITLLALLSFFQVNGELERQSRRKLHEAGRIIGNSISERLNTLGNDIMVLNVLIRGNEEKTARDLAVDFSSRLEERFLELGFKDASGKTVSLIGGRTRQEFDLRPGEQEHLRSGKTLMIIRPGPEGKDRICLLKQVLHDNRSPGLVYGIVKDLYLWGLDEHFTLSANTDLTILNASGRIIFTTHPFTPPLGDLPILNRTRSSFSGFEWKNGTQKYHASFWGIFTKHHWNYPKLTVILSASKDHVFATIQQFKKIYPLVILMSLWVVLLLSAALIRKTTQPLQELKKGTQRITEKDFETKVAVKSGDEFEELCHSFNRMAGELGRQFNVLITISDIQRAILSSLDKEEIIDAFVTRMHDLFGFEVVGVLLQNGKDENRARVKMMGKGTIQPVASYQFSPDEIKRFTDNRHRVVISADGTCPDYLRPFVYQGISNFIAFPFFVNQCFTGMIVIGTGNGGKFEEEDLVQIRRLADQLAVALSNARLLDELDLMNWGTLKALARTVDAKSPWTAGHSERVAETALKIGHGMGLSPAGLDNLRRAALLHDIGKIGIPHRILDKPVELTESERRVIEGHPAIGARILEPISAYADLIPMVLQHHERFDGKGYPKGIAGNDICLEGRILAVADVYDALVSSRPYRSGMKPLDALEFIKHEQGSQFDPDVVSAFLKVLSEDLRRNSEMKDSNHFSHGSTEIEHHGLSI